VMVVAMVMVVAAVVVMVVAMVMVVMSPAKSAERQPDAYAMPAVVASIASVAVRGIVACVRGAVVGVHGNGVSDSRQCVGRR
jgi:hypothetical protein